MKLVLYFVISALFCKAVTINFHKYLKHATRLQLQLEKENQNSNDIPVEEYIAANEIDTPKNQAYKYNALNNDLTDDELSLALSDLLPNELNILNNFISKKHAEGCGRRIESGSVSPRNQIAIKPDLKILKLDDPIQRIHQEVQSLRKESADNISKRRNLQNSRKKRESKNQFKFTDVLSQLHILKDKISLKARNASADEEYIKLLEDSFPTVCGNNAIMSDIILVRVKRNIDLNKGLL